MKASLALPLMAAFFCIGVAGSPAICQQPVAGPLGAACGPASANYNVTHDKTQSAPAQVPPGKALVYVIEAMQDYPIVTKKVNIGLDGAWLGATDAQTYISFTVDPGVHHLCAIYQGHYESIDQEGQTLLLRLNAEAGKTYFLRYHALFLKDAPGLAFFEPVDEDEGSLLLQRTQHATSVLKK